MIFTLTYNPCKKSLTSADAGRAGMKFLFQILNLADMGGCTAEFWDSMQYC
jgi:hypothetical protein